MEKRSQSALEFLLTYGWAMMALLIVIGALGYFGVFNPNHFLPDRCNFRTGIICDTDQIIITNDHDNRTMVAVVTNNFPEDVRIYGTTKTIDTDKTVIGDVDTECNLCFNNLSVPVCPKPSSTPEHHTLHEHGWLDNGIILWNGNVPHSAPLAAQNATLWPQGKPMVLVMHCDTGKDLPDGSKTRFIFKMKYFYARSDYSFSKDLSGEIIATVQ